MEINCSQICSEKYQVTKPGLPDVLANQANAEGGEGGSGEPRWWIYAVILLCILIIAIVVAVVTAILIRRDQGQGRRRRTKSPLAPYHPTTADGHVIDIK